MSRRELQHQGDAGLGRLQVRVFLPGGQQDLEPRVIRSLVVADGTGVVGGGECDPFTITQLAPGLECSERVPRHHLGHEALPGRCKRPFVEIGPIGRIRADPQGVLEERDRLRVRAERDRALGGAAERHSSLDREGARLRSVGRVPLRGEVVAGECSRQLVGPERLEEARCGEMADLAVALRERVIGDFPDQCLDERVLATVG